MSRSSPSSTRACPPASGINPGTSTKGSTHGATTLSGVAPHTIPKAETLQGTKEEFHVYPRISLAHTHIEGVCDVNLPCTSDTYQASVIHPMYAQHDPSLIHICSAFDTQIILTHCQHISEVYLTLISCVYQIMCMYIYIH